MRVSLLSQKHIFFSEGIKKLVQRWKKCIEKHGDDLEKCCYYTFSIFIEIKFVSVVRIIIDSLTYLHQSAIFGCQDFASSLKIDDNRCVTYASDIITTNNMLFRYEL